MRSHKKCHAKCGFDEFRSDARRLCSCNFFRLAYTFCVVVVCFFFFLFCSAIVAVFSGKLIPLLRQCFVFSRNLCLSSIRSLQIQLEIEWPTQDDVHNCFCFTLEFLEADSLAGDEHHISFVGLEFNSLLSHDFMKISIIWSMYWYIHAFGFWFVEFFNAKKNQGQNPFSCSVSLKFFSTSDTFCLF